MRLPIDLTGKKFGMLTAIKKIGVMKSGKSTVSAWLCKCDCGNETIVRRNNLISKTTKSCGCLQHTSEAKKRVARENFIKAREMCITHGLSNSRIYVVWKNMIHRCENNKNPFYKHYGGRGIKVCDEWKDIKTFYNWAIKNGYSEKLEIDRINNNGNYEPSNCRWATRKEQTNNERRNIRETINGENHTLAEWSEITGINVNTLQYRHYRGDKGERLIRPIETKYRRII